MKLPAARIAAVAAAVAVVVLAAGPLALAAGPGLQVEPGLWEFTTSLPSPMGGEAQRFVERTCVRDRTITPERVMARMTECRIWDAQVQGQGQGQGQAARWKMRCETPLGPMSGRGSLRSNGREVAGSLDLAMTVGAFEVPATSPFRGRRVGACR